MVAACRDMARMDREIRSGSWVTREGMQLSGKTLGIIGLGGIGREVARIGRGHWHAGDRLESHAAHQVTLWWSSTNCSPAPT